MKESLELYPHRIRLRGPWEVAGRIVRLPGPVAGLSGRVTFCRRFGYPGTIDAHERVWLLIEGLSHPADVLLNGEPLGEWRGQMDITSRLRSRNELVIITQAGPAPPWQEVALEVLALAWLRCLACSRTAEGIEVTGEVVGAAPHPLDLYLMAGRRTAAYLSMTPTAEGTPFRLEGAPSAGEEGQIKLELVCGSGVWYSVPLALSPEEPPGPG